LNRFLNYKNLVFKAMLDNEHTVVELSLFEQNCHDTILPLFSIYSNGINNIYPTGKINLRDLAYEICKEKKLQDFTQKLRNLRDEKERAEFKKTLSYVTFSGIFRRRSKEGLINHSGYICTDLDHVGDNTRLETIKKQILQKFTPGMMFISPSGNVLKVVFKIDLSQGTHEVYFSALSKYFKSEIKIDLDQSGKDVSRACFICYDPEVFFSESPYILSRSFIDAFNIIEQPLPTKIKEQITDFELIYQRCETWTNKKGQFTKGNRNNFITRLAGILNRCGFTEHFTLGKLRKYVEKGFTLKEIESTVRSIYRNSSYHGIAKLGGETHLNNTNQPISEMVKSKALLKTPLLPIEGLPEFLQNLIIECSNIYGTHRDFWSAAILSASCLALGKNFKIRNKYTNGAVLWFAIVAPTGSGKTEPLKFAFVPFQGMDSESIESFGKEMDKYDVIKGMGRSDWQSQGITHPPKLPICKQFILSDSTPEGLYQAHKNNPRGILMLRDEHKGWIDDFGRYSKSGEAANWISSWSEQAMTFNRKSERPMKISDPFICVAGSLQPSVLPELARDNRAANGFMVRFCFVYPDKSDRPYFQDKELPNSYYDKYDWYLKKLLSINNSGIEYITLSTEANKLYLEFDKWNTDLINSQESEYMRGMLAKLPIIALRLGLVIHYSHWAFDGIYRAKIEPETIQAAINMTKYFKTVGEKISRQLDICSIKGLNNKNVAEFLNIEKGCNQSEISRILKTSHQYVNKILKKH
jgi:hypothetical protein